MFGSSASVRFSEAGAASPTLGKALSSRTGNENVTSVSSPSWVRTTSTVHWPAASKSTLAV